MNKPLERLLLKLRPELAGLEGIALLAARIDLVAILTSAPLAVLGLIWLATLTDLDLLRQEWPVWLLFLFLVLVLGRYNYELELEVRPGVYATVSDTLESLLRWSAALIFGPTALWLGVAGALFSFILSRRQARQSQLIWAARRELFTSLGIGPLTGILGLLVYTALGGVYPYPGLGSGALLAAMAAVLVWMLAPVLISLPYLGVLLRSPDLVDEQSGVGRRAVYWFFIRSSLFSTLSEPFAILGAGTYARLGLGNFLFFMAGIWLISLLATQLSRAVKQSQQRARELAALEAMAEAILAASPDRPGLVQILADHLPAFRPRDVAVLQLWLYDQDAARPLYLYPEESQLPALAPNAVAALGPEYQLTANQTLADRVRNSQLRAQLTLPVWDGEAGRHLLGGMYLDAARTPAQMAELVPALRGLATFIANALRRMEIHRQTVIAERNAQELLVASRIQTSFLPQEVPAPPGWDITATLIPARQTSGDFYDFIPLPAGRWGLLVADVADKGTGAALYMALSRTLLRTFALQYPDAPSTAFAAANERILHDTQSDQFVTVFYGVLEPGTGRMTYCNAGHNPAYLLPAGNGPAPGAIQKLAHTGIPLGMFPGMAWQDRQITLGAGDVLLLYTDGVTEAQDQDNHLFADERLLAVSRAQLSHPAGTVQTAIIEALQQFTGPAPQFDDITLMVVKRQAPPPPPDQKV